MTKSNPKFLRRAWSRHSKLGLRRKKKQKWRKPTGRHNKLRMKAKGKSASVSIGYGTKKEERGIIDGKTPRIIQNLKDLENFPKNAIGILKKFGKKKKIQIAKIAKERGIKIKNLNLKKWSKDESKK